MTKFGRVRSVLLGLGTILLGVLILILPAETGVLVASGILGLSMVITGIRVLRFYFTMGRYMVGGSTALVMGAILLDFGIFTLTLVDNPSVIVVLYLLGLHAFLGLVDILRGLEARRYQSGSWRRSVASGLINLTFAGVALFLGLVMHSYNMLMVFYAIGLFCSGGARIGEGFRKRAIVYIQ